MTTERDLGARSAGAVTARAVLCLDEELRPPVRRHLDRLGFRVVGETTRGLEAVALAGETGTDLVVLDLALTGTLGLRLIPVLLAAAPDAVVVGVSQARSFDVAALEAGAHAVVGPSDLRHLRGVLDAVAARLTGDRTG
jgi:DNA-binding response OmpR family regulator